jgi:hypothetical protein
MGTRKSRAIAVALGLGLCLALLGAAPALAAPGAIEGRVSEPTEDEGLAEIEVCAIPATPADPPGACVATEDGSGVGPRGHYEIAGLEPGNYKVRFTPPPESQYVYQYYQRKLRFAGANVVEVESEGIAANRNAVLDVGGRAAGRVTDTTGVALNEIEVCIFSPLAPEFGTHCVESLANGKYEVLGLQTGSYLARFAAAPARNFFPAYHGGSSLFEAEEFFVGAGEETPDVDGVLEAGVAIEGSVSEAGTGFALAGIRVCVLDALTAAEVRCLASGFDGSYEVRGLHRGEYVVGFSVARPGVLSGEDAFVGQFYDDQPSFAAADRVVANQAGFYRDVDARLVRGPEVLPGRVSAPETTSPPAAKPAEVLTGSPPLRCRKGFKKKLVKGERRCVRVPRKQGKRRQGRRGGDRPTKSR